MISEEEEGSVFPQKGGNVKTDTGFTRRDGDMERQEECATPPAFDCRRLSELSLTDTSSDSGSSVVTLKSIDRMPSLDPSKMDQLPFHRSAISPNPGRAFEIALLHIPSEGEMLALPDATLPLRPSCPILRAESINGMDATAPPSTCAAVQGNAACATLTSYEEFRENGPSDVKTGAGPTAGLGRLVAAENHPPEQKSERMGGKGMKSHDERPSEPMPTPGSAGEIAAGDRANENASKLPPLPLNVTSKPREKIPSSHSPDGPKVSEVQRSATLNPTDVPPPSNVVGNASFSNGSLVEMEKKSSSSRPRFRAGSIKTAVPHQDALPGEEITIESVRIPLTEKQQKALRQTPLALTRYHTPPPHLMLLGASSGRGKKMLSKQDALPGMLLDEGEGLTDVHVVSLESGYTSHNEEACKSSSQKLEEQEVVQAPPPMEDVKQPGGHVPSATYDHPEQSEPHKEMGNHEIQRRLSEFVGAFQESPQRNWASLLSISPHASQGIVRSSSYTASLFKKRRSLDDRRSSDGSAPLVPSGLHLASTGTLEQCPLCVESPTTLADVATRISQILLDDPNNGSNHAFPLPGKETSKPLAWLTSEETSPFIFLTATEVHASTPLPVTTEVSSSPSPSTPLRVSEEKDLNVQEVDDTTGFMPPCRADDEYLGNLLPGTIAPFAPVPLSWHRRIRSSVAWLGDYDDDRISITSPPEPSLFLPASNFSANATHLPKQNEKNTDSGTVSESTGDEDLLEGFYPGAYKADRQHRFSSGVVFILERDDCFACGDNNTEGGDGKTDVRRGSRLTTAVPQVVPLNSPIIFPPHNKEIINQHSTLPIPQQDGGWQSAEDTNDKQGLERRKSPHRHSLSIDQYASLSLSSIYRPTSDKYAPDPNKKFCPITNVFRLRQHFLDSSSTASDDEDDDDGGYKFSDYGWEKE
ncbi:hypothetical protein MOQ_001638 [Trypanosoma cruzi marinkellei]|uniref:Uncharacterized protein n=1 Tax=Trypanosoma cruzi marinkellei TaxID=85056 RepID=K2NT32_TRYCR|nr:hypothetical protein MOQ_001638 [Trypanosoma cruzi marinkellei]